jgi:outer membrane protein
MILSGIVKAEFTTDHVKSDDARSMSFLLGGAGAIVTKEPYKGMGTENHGIPFFLYRTERLSLYGPMIVYSLFEDDDWEIRGLAKVRFEGYEEEDSRFLQGMDERKWTLEMGGSLSKNFLDGKITADFTADILNEHQGYELRLYYSYDLRDIFKSQTSTATPQIGVNYRSCQLNHYYYGVPASEAIAGRPEYHAGDSTGLMTGLRINCKLSEKWSLTGLVSFEWLGNEIKKSPIVDKDHIESYIFGIMYKF